MRVELLLVVSVILSLGPSSSCGRPTGLSGDEINPSYTSRLSSLSVSGTMQACLLVATSGSNKRLKLTADGGKTWREIDPKTIGEVLECAALGGDTRAWVVNRNGTVYTTTSGGANWARIAELKQQFSGEYRGANEILFVTEADGWINASLSLWRTKDGGTTWQEKLSVLTPDVKGPFVMMHAIDANTLFAIGSGRVYLSRDGGDSWKIKTVLTDAAADLTGLWFADKENGYIIGYVGAPNSRPLLFVTIDGGESWKELSIKDEKILPESVCFVGSEGWISGRRPALNERDAKTIGVLWHTTDAGRQWKPVELPFDDPFFSDVRFTDRDHGWLLGRDNLYRTEDRGVSWHIVLKLPPI